MNCDGCSGCPLWAWLCSLHRPPKPGWDGWAYAFLEPSTDFRLQGRLEAYCTSGNSPPFPGGS